MNDIWQTIADIAARLHPDRVTLIAERISKLTAPDDFPKMRASFGPGVDAQLVDSLEAAWREEDAIQPEVLAAAFRGASATAALLGKRETVELVWTGPSTGLVAPRHTEQALLEVIALAKQRLFLVSFVAYSVKSVNAGLLDAVGRNVRIDILLESSKEHGGKVDHDSAGILRKLLPSANIYAWDPSTEASISGTDSGAMHAKCAVADASVVFITSANLTSAAMERNMELGVLIKGGSLPKTLRHHLDSLVTIRTIQPV